MNQNRITSTQKVVWIILGLLLFLFIYHQEIGYSESIGWKVTSEAHKESFTSLSVSKGPFNFDLTGNLYFIKQKFSASDIAHGDFWLLLYSFIALLGISGFLAFSTYWKRYTFIAIGAAYMVFLNTLQLDQLAIWGLPPGGKWLTILSLIIIVGPAYAFHAFFDKVSFVGRWFTLFLITSGFLSLIALSENNLVEYLWSNGTYGMAIFTLFFVILIAEEIIYLILHIITSTKDGKDNEKHFLIFGGVYLAYITLYYLEKSENISTQITVLNPYYLLVISTIVAAWSLKYKQSLFNSISSVRISPLWLLLVLALAGFSYLNLSFVRGLDAGYEAFHYLIMYAHVGFGALFFLYIISNFITPLSQGLQVYKIVYQERNMPYSSARLAGLAAVAAFFFLANQEPMELVIGTKYNWLGDYYTKEKEPIVAKEYYTLSSQYAWDNHYANYQLARIFEKEDEVNKAYYRFYRASRRYPSPYAYINAARDLSFLKKDSEVVPLLSEAEADFPKSGEIKNNLALGYVNAGAVNQAQQTLKEAKTQDNWNDASRVNSWWIGKDSLDNDFDTDKIELKANILARFIAAGEEPPVTPKFEEFEGNVNLHKITYLINTHWAYRGFDSVKLTETYLENMRMAELKEDLRHAYAMSLFKGNRPVEAFKTMDALQQNANSIKVGYFLNQMGILALELNAPKLAADFFERAMKNNEEEAALNRAVALMEAGSWEKIQNHLMEAQLTMPRSLLQIINGEGDSSTLYTYYRWKNLEIAELKERLSDMSPEFVLAVWEKINNHFSTRDDSAGLVIYYENLKGLLPAEPKAHYQASLVEETYPRTEEELLNSAFDEWKIYNWLDNDTASVERKYAMLVQSTEYNPFSIGLFKRYCFAAIELGLYDYAEFGLLKLYELLPREEYNTFELIFEERKKQKQQDSWTF